MVRKGRADRCAAVDLYHQAVETAQRLLPESDPDKLFYMRYGIALVYRPDGQMPCHVCLQLNHNDPQYVELNKIEDHQKERHPHAKITCERCSVRLLCAGDAGKHSHYVHVRPSGWWNAAT